MIESIYYSYFAIFLQNAFIIVRSGNPYHHKDFLTLLCLFYLSLLICKSDYFAFSHMASSFLGKFNSQTFLWDWLCIKIGMKKNDWLLVNQSAMYV